MFFRWSMDVFKGREVCNLTFHLLIYACPDLQSALCSSGWNAPLLLRSLCLHLYPESILLTFFRTSLLQLFFSLPASLLSSLPASPWLTHLLHRACVENASVDFCLLFGCYLCLCSFSSESSKSLNPLAYLPVPLLPTPVRILSLTFHRI